MGAVASTARSRLRRTRRASALVTALVAVAVALVLAAAAGARRTAGSIDEFVGETRGAEGYVAFVPDGFGRSTSPDLVEEERRVAAVRGVAGTSRFVLGGAVLRGRGIPTGDLAVMAHIPIDPDAFPMITRPHIVDGRLADQTVVDEIVIDEELSRDADLGVGSQVDLLVPTPDQLLGRAFDDGGFGFDAVVVGVVRRPGDLRDPQTPQRANDYTTHPNVFLTAEVWKAAGGDVAVLNPLVAFDVEAGHDPASVLEEVVEATGAYPISAERFLEIEGTFNGVERSADLHARGLQAFALTLTLTALFVVGQTLGRQILLDSRDDPTLRALGMTSRDIAWASMLRAAPIGVAGAALGVVGAVALSPLAPLPGTVARRAAPGAGIGFDAVVLLPGAAAAVTLVLAVAHLSLRRAAGLRRVAAGRSTLASRLAARGLSPPVATGLRFALEPGVGRAAVPVRTALAAGITTVALVTAALVFTASLAGTRGDARRYGVTWDVAAGALSSPEEVDAMADRVAAIPGVDAFAGAYTTAFDTEFGEVPALLLQQRIGTVAPLVTAGRPPRRGEAALGALTMAEQGLQLGDDLVVVDQIAGSQTFEIVAEVVLNVAGLDVSIPPGRGMVLDWSALELLAGDSAAFLAPTAFFVDTAPGRTSEVEAALRELFPTSTEATPIEPLDLTNLGDASALPAALGGVVSVLGFGTLGHALLTTVVRRRHELAALKAMGLVRTQTRTVVVTQALTFGVVSLAVGVPLGAAGGRIAWAAAAERLGIPSHPVLSAASLSLVAVCFLLLLGVLSLLPARHALGVQPGAHRDE
ncbi:MAG TPA: FtsX-like permease family protein [Acidimicrobiales bacterium]|nr:FtsX-like permease family protein [Acidimicrobiales bacterium]